MVEGGYFGIAMVMGGLAIVLGTHRVANRYSALMLTLCALAFAAFGLSVAGGVRGLPALRSGHNEARRHVAGGLFALAALSSASAAGLYALGHGWFAAGTVGALVAAAAYAILPAVSELVTAVGLGLLLAVSIVAEVTTPTPLTVGAAMIATATLLAAVAVGARLPHRRVALGLAAVIALVGAQQPLARAESTGWAYGLTFAVGVACVAVYLEVPTMVPLVVGVTGVTLAVFELMVDATSGSSGMAATLVVSGVVLAGMSGLGLQLWRSRGGW